MKKVVVLFGSNSTEHIVSCHSAQFILKEFDKKKYLVDAIYITRNQEWYYFDYDFSSLYQNEWEQTHQNDKISNILETLKKYDVVFPVFHGKYGEDGCIQGLLEFLSLPYVGCHVTSSALCFDKVFTKEILEHHQIPVVPYQVITKKNYSISKLEESLGYPMIIKPARGGSSIGIQVAHNRKELIRAIHDAFQYDHKLLVETFIQARELECAILEKKELHASSIGEIFSANSFYDYDAKYNDNQTYTKIGAELDSTVKNKIQELSKKVFQLLECTGLARVDFFYQEDTNTIYVNEINTLPGFTENSMFAKLLQKDHISYSKIISILIEQALTQSKK